MKVINILQHCPAYELIDNVRPLINWDTPNDTWVGIWGYDWPDLIGNEVLKLTNEFEYEIWQPDTRADKIYCHKFDNGLVHRLFPAEIISSSLIYKKTEKLQSKLMIDRIIKESKSGDIIVNVNSFLLNPITHSVLKICEKLKIPVLDTLHGNIDTYYYRIVYTKNIFKLICQLYNIHLFKMQLKKCKFITYQNNDQLEMLKQFKIRNIEFLTMGCDFEYWKAIKTIKPKVKKTFLIASRFVPLKQIDKILEIFLKLNSKYDFKIFIAGHGESAYEQYLKDIATELGDKVEFLGYLSGESMLSIYQKSDMFITSSITEGCPVSAMKAIACNISVFSTNVGGIAEILKRNNSGILVDRYDYKKWEEELIKFIEGNNIETLNREIARKYFDWPSIAKKFLNIYKQMR
jgi:Glycosyltransferase